MPGIKTNYFLASISGNNVVWSLRNHQKEEILTYHTLKDVVVRHTDKTLLADICRGVYELEFTYFTSPDKRRKYIQKVNATRAYEEWADNWREEYELCK